MRATSALQSRPTSRVTASKTTDGGPAWATKVATRRSADCSSAMAPRACSDAIARRLAVVANAPTMTDIARNRPSTSSVAVSRSRNGGRKYQSKARTVATPTGSAYRIPASRATASTASSSSDPSTTAGTCDRAAAHTRAVRTKTATPAALARTISTASRPRYRPSHDVTRVLTSPGDLWSPGRQGPTTHPSMAVHTAEHNDAAALWLAGVPG